MFVCSTHEFGISSALFRCLKTWISDFSLRHNDTNHNSIFNMSHLIVCFRFYSFATAFVQFSSSYRSISTSCLCHQLWIESYLYLENKKSDESERENTFHFNANEFASECLSLRGYAVRAWCCCLLFERRSKVKLSFCTLAKWQWFRIDHCISFTCIPIVIGVWHWFR